MLYTDKKFTEFSANLNNIVLLLNQNNWKTAKYEIENLNNQFESHEKNLQLFLNRDNLKEIQQNLNKLQTAIQFQEKPKSISQILKLHSSFKKIVEDEKPLIHNIL